MDRPNWTVVCSTIGDGDWVGKSWTFFEKEINADRFYRTMSNLGHVPTMRPFHVSDLEHMQPLPAAAIRTSDSLEAAEHFSGAGEWLKDRKP